MNVALANKYKSQPFDYAQPKLDGIRCIYDAEKMFTRTKKEIVSQPHILAELKQLNSAMVKHNIQFLDGELYNHDLNEEFNKISSLVSKKKTTNESNRESKKYIEYHIYDACIKGKRFEEVYSLLCHIFMLNDYKYLELVTTYSVENKRDSNNLYDKFTTEGYEGMILRQNTEYKKGRSNYIMKVKEFKDCEFIIKDIKEGKGKHKNKASVYIIPKNTATGEKRIIAFIKLTPSVWLYFWLYSLTNFSTPYRPRLRQIILITTPETLILKPVRVFTI